jgi:hypothetical protein
MHTAISSRFFLIYCILDSYTVVHFVLLFSGERIQKADSFKEKHKQLSSDYVSPRNFAYLKGKYHEMVCQLRPFVYCVGLNNPPRICLTESRASKIYDVTNKGTVDVKWRVQEFAVKWHELPQTGITHWQTALKRTADWYFCLRLRLFYSWQSTV